MKPLPADTVVLHPETVGIAQRPDPAGGPPWLGLTVTDPTLGTFVLAFTELTAAQVAALITEALTRRINEGTEN